MKKILAIILMSVLLCTAPYAMAAKQPQYTLSKKNNTVLQNNADREIDVQSSFVSRSVIPGESPVTGLPWDGEYLPMLVQINVRTGDVTVNHRTVKTTGAGKFAPWGIQYADVLYEELTGYTGGTRFSVLFSDCFAQGQPAAGVGPVRSCRLGALMLREEWQSGFVFGGGLFRDFHSDDPATQQVYQETGVMEKGMLINTLSNRFRKMCYRVQGKKAPGNRNADIISMRDTIPDDYISTPHPFLFTDEVLYGDNYTAADVINLDWGYKYNITHFVYDPSRNAYLRYCGAGINPAKWAPFTVFATAESTESDVEIPFANLIVQRVEYERIDNSLYKLSIHSIGKGNADIFIGDRYIPGYWVRASLSEPTVFYDDQGNELQFNRGKTFIAQFPVEALCTFTSGD
ncbi:MAG: DUF3048 C-terminal domain-containing protein [Eubacteriales bacterium]|nr:DUF3048 C-terminal domain-containing protein [Eubacteriales bacterium]